MQSNTSVLVVEDDTSTRERFSRVISGHPQLDLVGDAGDLATGIELLHELTPDVLLMDLDLPDGNGMSLIEEIEIASGASAEVIDLDMLRIENSQELKVLSPSTGVFFRTPSPSEPEYVSVGDQVTVEDTLCVLEAMKMEHAIKAAIDGTVAVVHASVGDMVEGGVELIGLTPLE